MEESEAGAKNAPLTYKEGCDLINILESKLNLTAKREREGYFTMWRTKIEVIYKMGGYDADAGGHYLKSIPAGASSDEARVDLEIRKGKAFI